MSYANDHHASTQVDSDAETKKREYRSTRRSHLKYVGLGGATVAAGCLGDNGDTPGVDLVDPGEIDAPAVADTDLPEDAEIDGQTLVLTTPVNPDRMHFLGIMRRSQVEHTYEYASGVHNAMHEAPVWSQYHGPLTPSPDNYKEGTFPRLIEDFDLGPETITVNLREDANWSDGEPVRAFDGVATAAYWSWPHPDYGWYPPPAAAHTSRVLNSFSMPDGPDGKVYELHVREEPEEWRASAGFHITFDWSFQWLTSSNPRWGPNFPSHVEPFKSMSEQAVEDLDNHTPEEDLDYTAGADGKATAFTTPEDFEQSREDPPPTSGMWQLDEIHGTEEVVLKPNEHHWEVDNLNFEEVVFDFSAEDYRTRAALQADVLDYASVDSPPEAVEAYPDIYDEIITPAGTGYGLNFDYSSAFGDRLVRHAMMYAIHTPDIAANIHPTKTQPIITPSWDTWVSEEFINEDWAEENLLSFEQDLDRAANLMEEAGYSLEDGVWEKDGERLETQLATSNESPVFETTITEQLGDFGIDMHVQTYDPASFSERKDGVMNDEYMEPPDGQGEFDVWVSSGGVGRTTGNFPDLPIFWWDNVGSAAGARKMNIYPSEITEQIIDDHYQPSGWSPHEAALWKELTIDVPPIGDPDGDRSPFNPSTTWINVWLGEYTPRDPQADNPYYNPPRDEPHEENEEYFWKQFAWVNNWWMCGLPVALEGTQHYLNTTNWLWPHEVSAEDNDLMWGHFGQAYGTTDLVAMGKILVDPENPKD